MGYPSFFRILKHQVRFVVYVSVVFFGIHISSVGALSGFEAQTVVSGLVIPTAMTFAPDGRIFIAQKGGAVRVIKNGTLLSNPLITLTDINTYGDRGLIGIAIDPNFATNGYLYLSYTYENSPGANIAGPKTGRIVRVTVVGDTALESSKVVLLGTVGGTLATPSCENYLVTADCIPSDDASHSVGGLQFGPDGRLYATLGDGASFDYADPRSLRAQNIDSLAGKVIRINRDGTAPSDNPFYNGDGNANRSKVWALGVRNMFRFTFRPGTNTMFAGDVGWNLWEEINVVNAGNNLGWPCYEGIGTTVGGLGCSVVNPISPFYTYPHTAAGAGSVTGGDFLGAVYPSIYNGAYVYGDYAQNTMTLMRLGSSNTILSQEPLITSPGGPVDIKTGPDGYIYYIAIYTGELKRINYTEGNRKPVAVPSSDINSGLTPLKVNFSASGSSDPDGDPLTYAWNFGDGGTATGIAPSHTYATAGAYDAVLSVQDGSGGIDIKSTRIFAGNQRPSVTIVTPSNGAFYRPGDTIVLSGTGVDPETGILPNSAFYWQTLIHHNTHIHYLQDATGQLASFVAPDHNDPDVYVEVILTVTDPSGVSSASSLNMYLNNGIETVGNLIQNPGMEQNTAVADTPDFWSIGWYGDNSQIWTYPIVGDISPRASRVQVTRYVSGDAKWVFDPVSVDANTSYIFSDAYQSNIATDVIVDIGYADGTHTYHIIGTLQPSNVWKTFTSTFTTPVGARTATVFHRVMGVGLLDTDNYIWMKNVGQSLPPIARDNSATGSMNTTITIPNILANDEAFGSGNSLRTSSIDLNPLISEPQTTLIVPEGTFSVSPSSAIVLFTPANSFSGRVTIPYTVQDTLGQQAQASIIVTVSVGSVPPTTTNLVLNPSVETGNAAGTLPLNWNQGGYGTNTAVFTYPATGIVGAKSIRVAMSQYTSGDAKWYFDDVSVTPGKVYTYGEKYIANVPSSLFVRYQFGVGTFSYVFLRDLPASTTATGVQLTLTPPAGVTSLTIWQAISGVGNLTIDDISLTGDTSTSTDTTPPVLTFTSPLSGSTLSGVVNLVSTIAGESGGFRVNYSLDAGGSFSPDGTGSPYSYALDTTTISNGTHTITARAIDTAGNESIKSITVTIANTVTPPATNLVRNPSVETGNAAGTLPLNWNQGGYGTNTTVFTYPAAGIAGARSIRVAMSQYTSGDAKWYFDDVSVTPGRVYTYGEKYIANVPSSLFVRYQFGVGTFSYVFLRDLPASATATGVQLTLTPPAGVTSLTIWQAISGVGNLTVDDISLTGDTPTQTDTTLPTISITSPTEGSTGTGQSVTLSANASDNIGIIGVQFRINGVNQGNEDTTSPYSLVWNTASVPNGSYGVTAIARDAAGNSRTASTVTVILNKNTTSTGATGTGLTLFFDGFEDQTFNAWNNNKGSNLVMSAGTCRAGPDSNLSAVKITGTDTIGTQLLQKSVSTLGYQNILLSFCYKWDTLEAGDTVILEYTTDGSSWKPIRSINNSNTLHMFYAANDTEIATSNGVGLIPTAIFTTPEKLASYSIPLPADAANSASFALRIRENLGDGDDFVWMDDIRIVGTQITGTPTDTTPPVLTFTSPLSGSTLSGVVNLVSNISGESGGFRVNYSLDAGGSISPDGTSSPYSYALDTTSISNGTHTITARAIDTAGNESIRSITVTIANTVSPPTTNLVLNPSVETAGASGNIPLNWNQGGFGSNTTVFTYPTTGITGARSISVGLTSYVDGNAKWYFDDVSVTPGKEYIYTERYIANIPSTLTARLRSTTGNYTYIFLDRPPATTGSAALLTASIVIPADTLSMTVWHSIAQVGSMTVDDISVTEK